MYDDEKMWRTKIFRLFFLALDSLVRVNSTFSAKALNGSKDNGGRSQPEK
jgi:hypothetical protein